MHPGKDSMKLEYSMEELRMTFDFPDFTAQKVLNGESIQMLNQYGQFNILQREHQLPFFVAHVDQSNTKWLEIFLPLWVNISAFPSTLYHRDKSHP